MDSERSIRAGLRELLGAEDAWTEWCATSARHYLRFTAGEVDFDTMRRQRTREFFASRGEALDEREVAERERRRMAASRRAWRLFDDALRCLLALRAAGLRLAAVTNAPGPHQRDKLTALGLLPTFDALIISDEVGTAKPDPGIFHTACTALQTRPGQIVHVGDRLDADACGARNAGLHAVWLDRTGTSPDARGDGIATVSGLDELPELIARLG